MRITIVQRFRPYSHTPGTRVVLPCSTLRLQLFPSLIRVERLGVGDPEVLGEVHLAFTAPLEQFTVSQDLEESCVRMWGRGVEGFIRLRFSMRPEGSLEVFCEKAPVTLSGTWGTRVLQPKESMVLLSGQRALAQVPSERLSLGSHRALDGDALRRNLDLITLLPLWMRLGQSIPALTPPSWTGTAALLRPLPQLRPEQVFPALRHVLMAGFAPMLSPRLLDDDHHGFQLPEVSADASPLGLLTQGSRLIRGLFLQQENHQLSFLPNLPPECHAGRLVDVDCDGLGTLSLEWSKKLVRRVVFCPKSSGAWTFRFRHLEQFRVRSREADRGDIHHSSQPLHLDAGQPYLFDKFQK